MTLEQKVKFKLGEAMVAILSLEEQVEQLTEELNKYKRTKEESE